MAVVPHLLRNRERCREDEARGEHGPGEQLPHREHEDDADDASEPADETRHLAPLGRVREAHGSRSSAVNP